MLLVWGSIVSARSVDAAQPPPDFDARYAVEKSGIKIGQSHLRFRRPQPGYYDYRLYTHATGIARWVIASEVIEHSRGEITASGFRPTDYQYERRGDDKARRAQLHFDWSANEVINDVASYPWRMDITADTIDRVISPLQLMHDLAEREPDKTELTYRIADGGQLKTYLLSVEESEMITTRAGQFEALRIRRRDTDSDRYTLLWCAPALAFLAVQVEQWEHGDLNFRLSLAEVDGLPAPTP
jgi:hypothetical protein